MKILYDYQMFTWQRYGGITRYFYEIMKNRNKDEFESRLAMKFTNNFYLQGSDILKENKIKYIEKNYNSSSFKNSTLRKVFNKICNNPHEKKNRKYSISALKKQNFDLFHPTYYRRYFLDYLEEKPFVLTIHDMIHELFCDRYPNYRTGDIDDKRELANRASHILAVSENTKRDVMRLYNIPENKITVTYLGSSMDMDSLNLNALSIKAPEKYILFVGSRRAYKNFYFFLYSIVPLLKRDSDLYLVCAGGERVEDLELDILRNIGIDNKVIFFDKINDNILAYLYKNSRCFVFPSQYEGFGIPILEAFSCEAPIVISNKSSFPEITLDSASYFDPYNSESILSSIERVVYDDDLRKSMIEKGKKRVKDFSWKRTAELTEGVYKKIIESKR